MESLWVVAVWSMLCPDVGHTGSPCFRKLNETVYESEAKCLPARDRARGKLVMVIGLPEHQFATAQCRPLDHLNDYPPRPFTVHDLTSLHLISDALRERELARRRAALAERADRFRNPRGLGALSIG